MWVQRVAARRSHSGGERQLQFGNVATGHRAAAGQKLTHRHVVGGAGHMSGLGCLARLLLQMSEENFGPIQLDLCRDAA